MEDFHQSLLRLLPPRDDVFYHVTQELTVALDDNDLADRTPMALHPTVFSWSACSSIKGHPEASTCVRLCEDWIGGRASVLCAMKSSAPPSLP